MIPRAPRIGVPAPFFRPYATEPYRGPILPFRVVRARGMAASSSRFRRQKPIETAY